MQPVLIRINAQTTKVKKLTLDGKSLSFINAHLTPPQGRISLVQRATEHPQIISNLITTNSKQYLCKNNDSDETCTIIDFAFFFYMSARP